MEAVPATGPPFSAHPAATRRPTPIGGVPRDGTRPANCPRHGDGSSGTAGVEENVSGSCGASTISSYLLTTLAPFVFPAWRQLKRPVRAAAAESGAIAPAR